MEPSAAEGAVEKAKELLRRQMIERRQALSASDVRTRSEALCARLLPLCLGSDTQTIALYAAIRNEVDLGPLATALIGQGRTTAYPRVTQPAALTFHRVAAPADLAPGGPYRIPEPPASAPLLEPADLDLIILPGLAFDERGHRLGWGAGYYDTLLPRAPRARRVGVCYDFQLVTRCPTRASDEPVHLVVTETKVLDATLSKEVIP